MRQAIADKFKRENGLSYKPSQIIVSCGGKHSCYNVIIATCEEGDEVIIPAPYWLSYPEMVKLAGAKPVILQTTDKTEFKVTPEQLRAAITPRTRLFMLNSPSNPTGSVYTPEEIKALGDICVEKGVLIMSDEIYEHSALRRRHAQERRQFLAGPLRTHDYRPWLRQGLEHDRLAAGFPRRARTDRQGHRRHPKPQHEQSDFLCAKGRSRGADRSAGPPQKLAGRISTTAAPTPGKSSTASREFPASTPRAPFICSRTFPRLGLESTDFCARLLEKEKVAAVPGIAFGADDYLRISYATSMANIEKGLDRIERFCKTLG